MGAGRRIREVRPIRNRNTITLTNTRIPAAATVSWGTKSPVTDSSAEMLKARVATQSPSEILESIPR